MINLGNVAGVVISPNPPKEADGVTEKRYVLWAQPISGTSYHALKWFNTQSQEWETLNATAVIDDSMSGPTAQSNSKTFSKFMVLQLINGVNKTIPFGQFTVYKQSGNIGTVAEDGDLVQGWFSATKFIKAIYNGGGMADIGNYTLLEELDF